MSRTLPGNARQEWPHDEGRDQWRGEGRDVAGSGYSDNSGPAPEDDPQGYGGQAYAGNGHPGQGHQRQSYPGQGYHRQGHHRQGHHRQGHQGRGYPGHGYHRQGQDYQGQTYQGQDYQAQDYQAQAYPGQGYDGQGYAWQQDAWQGDGFQRDTRQRSGEPGQRKVRFRRLRRFTRRPVVRVIGALVAVFLVFVMFSAGQAAFKNNGQSVSANLAEWARDHYLGPVVTFGEWLTYQPPKTGGHPSFSYTVPKGEQLTQTNGKHHKGFVPDIPPSVKTLASGAPRPGEGQWRVIEKVKGQPAILSTFLRDGGQFTSYSNGIASIDQRLVKFSLRPGTEDPGAANWGVPNYIPSGQRAGLLATFNGGFKLDSSQGGFYLNGIYHGSLVSGTAAIVYYKNGTIKVGMWGRDFHMNSKIEGVRQNLKLLVDHGKVSPDANLAVNTSWGATLGGGAWVWRSGIGITKDGRVLFVYGQALDAKDLAKLLQRAGAVEAMQMDINPEWMKFDYYQADGHPGDPTPVPLLPIQQASPYSYYTPSTRDFTAVYAR